MTDGPITWPNLADRPLGHTVKCNMAASPAAVYLAWTEQFERWFAAPGTVLMRGEVDTPYFFETHFEGSRHPHYGRFLAVQPNRRVVMTWMTGTPGTGGAETVVTVELEPVGAGTHVRLTHAGFLTEEARSANEEAWRMVLPHLDEVLSSAESR